MGFWVRYSESQWQPPMGLQTLYPKQEPKTKKLRSSAALKSNKSNPQSDLIYLTLFGTGFVV
jgi:hypothetical protein